MPNLDVIVIGGAALDWVAQVETLPPPDGFVMAHTFGRFPGGSAANVAVALARLGWRTGWAGKLGDDEAGRTLLRAFTDEGVDVRTVAVASDRATAATFVAVDRHGERIIVGIPGIAAIARAEELDPAYLKDIRALYVGPPTTEAALSAATTVRQQGSTVFYAAGATLPPGGLSALRPMLAQADVLLVSRRDAEALTGERDPGRACQVLSEVGPAVVVETLGVDGALLVWDGQFARVPAFQVPNVRDTTGAGDAFAAGLITSSLEGADWITTVRMGNAVAALKIQHLSARSGLPTRETVSRFLAAQRDHPNNQQRHTESHHARMTETSTSRLQVVGIVASPRKGKNTDTLVTRVLEGSRSVGAETEKIYLNDLDIRPCQACARSPAPEYCFYKDGMETIYRAIATADVLVIGTPAYYGSISAQLKLLVDRSSCLTEMITGEDGNIIFQSRLEKQKRGIFIWVADSSRNPEHALATIKLWCQGVNAVLADRLIVTDADRGEGARKREDLLHRAFQLGASLAATT